MVRLNFNCSKIFVDFFKLNGCNLRLKCEIYFVWLRTLNSFYSGTIDTKFKIYIDDIIVS